MIYDPWQGEPVDDEPPFVGKAALLAGFAGVTFGMGVVAAALAAYAWIRERRWP